MTHLNPEGEVLLENQVREKVRMPGGGQVEESRRKMEGVMNLVRNDYIYAYSQNRFLQNLRHHFNEMALSRLEIVQIEQGQRNILSQDSIFQEKNLQNVRLSEMGFLETRFPEKRQEEMLAAAFVWQAAVCEAGEDGRSTEFFPGCVGGNKRTGTAAAEPAGK